MKNIVIRLLGLLRSLQGLVCERQVWIMCNLLKCTGLDEGLYVGEAETRLYGLCGYQDIFERVLTFGYPMPSIVRHTVG